MTRRFFAALLVMVATSCQAGPADDQLIVLAPSSMAHLQDEFDIAIEAEGLAAPKWVFAGSHSLVSQLHDGAPADVVITADEATFAQIRDTPFDASMTAAIATNHLVLAVAPGNPANVSDPTDVSTGDAVVGICTAAAPCGRLLADVEAQLGLAIAASTEEPNVRALTTKINLGELDAGFIYATDAQAAGLETVRFDDLATFTNQTWAAATNEGRYIVDVLISDAGRAVLAEAGFGS